MLRSLRNAFCVCAILGFAAVGQERTASITGVVRDPSNAGVPAAQVTLRNTETGIKRVVRSSGNGDYTVTLLEPGSYQALVEHPGFKSSQRSGIELHVDDSVRRLFANAG